MTSSQKGIGLGALILSAVLICPLKGIDPVTTLECHRRQYSYKVQQTDSDGKTCWDHINVMSCWGRCDSNEIADWRFPYKKSHHPVCLHSSTQENQVTLRNCDEGVHPETRLYTFQEAASCGCSFCKSSEASCEGLRYRGARRAPRQTKRIRQFKRDKLNSDHSVNTEVPMTDKNPTHILKVHDFKRLIKTALKAIDKRNLEDFKYGEKKFAVESSSGGQIPYTDPTIEDFLPFFEPTERTGTKDEELSNGVRHTLARRKGNGPAMLGLKLRNFN